MDRTRGMQEKLLRPKIVLNFKEISFNRKGRKGHRWNTYLSTYLHTDIFTVTSTMSRTPEKCEYCDKEIPVLVITRQIRGIATGRERAGAPLKYHH